jgi:kynureninase
VTDATGEDDNHRPDRQDRVVPTSLLGPFPDDDGFDEAVRLDREDPLSGFRDHFSISDPDLIYLDGNSLGRLPEKTRDLVSTVVDHEWGERLIRSWNEGWWDLHVELGERLAPILGARQGEVIVSDSTSVNLFKLATAALRARAGRGRIVTDDLNFPTDVYVLSGVAEAADAHLEIVPSDGISGPVDGLERAIDESTSLVSLSHTTFKSGYTYDLAEITSLAHRHGALMLWDLSHSAGVVPIDLTGSGVDLAVGCTYKYLNGGPGSPAFLYVRSEAQSGLDNPIPAWWGHAEPFAFDLEFRPAEGIRRFHTGTMPVLSLTAIAGGLAAIEAAGVDRIRAKSVSLTGFLITQWERHLAPLGFGLASPREPARRGSHVSLSHEAGWPIARAMVETAKVIPDFRAPDSIRLGLAPLYTRHVDVHTAVQRIRRIVAERAHLAFGDSTAIVT